MKSFKSFISESYENRVASAATAVTQKGNVNLITELVIAGNDIDGAELVVAATIGVIAALDS